jgi:ribosome recycling factor
MTVPSLTDERRKEIVKGLHKMTEECRVGVRGHRREALDSIKKAEKAKELSEDDVRRRSDEIQKVTDKYISEIDVLLGQKEREILEN